MARKNNRSNGNFGNFQIVNVDFSVEEKVQISSWIEDNAQDVHDIFYQVLQTDFKISVSYHKTYECFQGAMTDKRPQKSPGKACVYMFKHADLRKLYGVMAWYFTVPLQDGESDASLVKADVDW